MKTIELFITILLSVYLTFGIMIWLIGILEGVFKQKKWKSFLFLLFLWPLYLYINSISKDN